jgi:RNA polymerase sigma-70 factor (family 1)
MEQNPVEASISIEEFEQLFHKNYENLCLIAVRYVHDIDLARDLVQEFFIYLWNKKDQIKLQSTFEAYASRSVKNISATYIKRQKKHVVYSGDELPEVAFDPELIIAEESVKEQIYEKLRKAVRNLPEERRKLFLMSNVEGLTYSEIAERNNISINTVKTQIKKAYATLRTELPGGMLIFLFLLRH